MKEQGEHDNSADERQVTMAVMKYVKWSRNWKLHDSLQISSSGS